MLAITLPWPPKALHPNARVHYMALAKAKKAYRAECGWQAAYQGARALADGPMHVSIEFVPPDRRRRDLDGMLSAIKSGLDGISDAIHVDDSKWRLSLSKADKVGGYVIVTVSPSGPADSGAP